MRRIIARISLAAALFATILFVVFGRFSLDIKPVDGFLFSASRATVQLYWWDTARWDSSGPAFSFADTGWHFAWKPEVHLGHNLLNPGLGDGQTFVTVPLWMPAVLFGLLNLIAGRRGWRDRCRCGYDLSRLPPATPCPRCGAIIADRS